MNYSSSYSDVIIVGAGPAGCACALALRDSGLNVSMVEKSIFPRDKVCGDAIGGRVVTVLKKIDPALQVEFEKFTEKNSISGWRLVSPGEKSVRVKFVNPGYVSKRVDFDNWLFEKAIATSVKYIHAEVKTFKRDNGVSVLGLEGGEKLNSAIVIGCDGAQSSILRSTRPFEIDPASYSGAVRAYYSNISGMEENEIEIHLVKNFLPGYFWIFPINATHANVGFGMLSSDISKRKINLRNSLDAIINNSSSLSARFKNSTVEGKITGFGLPLGGIKRKLSGDGFLLCGDSASLIDPLNGEGIGNAMLSGYYAAQQVNECFRQNNFSPEFVSAYDKQINRVLLPELRRKLFFQKLFNRSWLIDSLVSAGSKNAWLRDWIGRRL